MKPTPSKASEKRYYSDLKKIARISSMIIATHTDGWKFDVSALVLLSKYSEQIDGWANRTASKMLSDTNANSDRFFSSQMKSIGKEYNRQLAESIAGMKAKQLQAEQVELIKSIPLKAGLRAQELSQQAAANSTRASEVAKEIARTNEVTENRAMLIARTETAKATAMFNEARAVSVGATKFVWRTAEDGDVRESHAQLNGEVYDINNPPCIDGEGCNMPGTVFNCRCYAEYII